MSSPFSVGAPRVWREVDGLSSLPREWSMYRFVNVESKDTNYIGVTSDLYGRIAKHKSKGTHYSPRVHLVRYQIPSGVTAWSEMLEWECKKIAEHRPEFNVYKGGNGRPPRVLLYGQEVEIPENSSIEDAVIQAGLWGRLSEIFGGLWRG